MVVGCRLSEKTNTHMDNSINNDSLLQIGCPKIDWNTGLHAASPFKVVGDCTVSIFFGILALGDDRFLHKKQLNMHHFIQNESIHQPIPSPALDNPLMKCYPNMK